MESGNDKHEVFRPGNAGRERVDRQQQGGGTGGIRASWPDPWVFEHCVHGFLIPTDISLQVPKCLPGPNPESHKLPWEKAMDWSITEGFSANKPYCDLPVLQHQLL